MKKKNLLKRLLAIGLISALSLSGLVACSGPTASADNTPQPSITLPGQTLEVSRYSTTFNQEANTIDIELNATVYPTTLSPALKWTFESATDGVFDNGTSVNDVAEIIPNGSSAVVRVKRAFLGGTITVKCETIGLYHNVSGVTKIEYQGLPTEINATYNGLASSRDNPIPVCSGFISDVNLSSSNFFNVIGADYDLSTFDFGVKVFGTIKCKATITTLNKTLVNNLEYTFDENQDFNSARAYFQFANDGTFTEEEVEESLGGFFEDCSDRAEGWFFDARLCVEDGFGNPIVTMENGIISGVYFYSATELSGFRSKDIQIYDDILGSMIDSDLEGYVSLEYDFSDMVFFVGAERNVNGTVLSGGAYFKVLPTATGLEIAGGNVVI